MKRILIPFFLLITSIAFAGTVDTVLTYSPSMKKNIKAVVITPAGYKKENRLPVVYLLHGHGGDQSAWIKNVPSLVQYADLYQQLIVCPDGNIASWYFDSPVDSAWRYETYVSKELVQWIDEHYATINNKNGRAITGLSMGGHGALYLAFKHQDIFGAAGSMSGGVDITPFPNNWDIAKRLGTYANEKERWQDHSVINLTYLLMPNSLAIIVDCGKDDFFYQVNVHLHEKLLYNNIPHDFIIRPGAHNWEYWNNAVAYQLLFFNRYFTATTKK